MIGGNLTLTFQKKSIVENEIGEDVESWTNEYSIKGWLDLSSGTYTHTHNTKIEESDYMFIADYNSEVRNLPCEQYRCVVNNRAYELKFIDDPMEIKDHLEIFLKLVGVVNA